MQLPITSVSNFSSGSEVSVRDQQRWADKQVEGRLEPKITQVDALAYLE